MESRPGLRRLTRLGEGQEPNGEISEEAMERTGTAIARWWKRPAEQGQGHRLGRDRVLRTASNRDDVIDHIRKRTGFTVEAISGEEEARLAYLAVKAELGLDRGSMVVFDTGGEARSSRSASVMRWSSASASLSARCDTPRLRSRRCR